LEDGVEVGILWISSQVVIEGNEIVDKRARHVALNGAVFDRPLQDFARFVLLREWQGKKDAEDTGRLAHSILPKVSFRPWFEGQKEDRKFVSTVSRIMSCHCTARSHLSRFRIVEGAVCIFLKDYKTVDHLKWHCERLETKTERRRLTDALDEQVGTPVRDLCALNKWWSDEVLSWN
jgi:hypothetical protein